MKNLLIKGAMIAVTISVIFIIILIPIVNAKINYIEFKNRPDMQSNAIWISEDKQIVLFVYRDFQCNGYMFVENRKIEFYLSFDSGRGPGIYLYNTSVLQDNRLMRQDIERWSGDYMRDDKFVATVKQTTYFEVGQKITFYKIEREQGNNLLIPSQ